MPVTLSRGRGSADRVVQTFMDWTRRVMQISVLISILIYIYLFYGLFFGDMCHWSAVTQHAEKLRIISVVDSAIRYLNVSLALSLLTTCILFYEEEVIGYLLVAGAVGLYYGMPLAIGFMAAGQLEDWQHTGNIGALAIFNQVKLLALMMAIPGAILAFRDIVLRLIDGTSRKRDEFGKLEYGGKVKEEVAPTGALLGVFAKCWQLPYCRAPIRKNCPIFLNKTKCWKHRCGCMCEESVIRHSMDAIISKEDINMTLEKSLNTVDDGLIKMDGDVKSFAMPDIDKTVEVKAKQPIVIAGSKVKIPHNPNLSDAVKRERCKECVIYNEHQRKKYQILAPLVTIGIPVLAYLQIGPVVEGLNKVFASVDKVMSGLSLVSSNGTHAASNMFNGAGFAQYIIIGCFVLIFTTWALRAVEYVVFKLKI